MRRSPATKMQILHARHPRLSDEVHAMFAECWPLRDVKHMIESRYGEHLSLSCLEKYKSKQWRAQRELAEQASAALAAPRELARAAGGAR